MYEEYWGLKEKPFENTADPRFLYKSPQHEEGLSRLHYVVDNKKGLAMLTGVFGCGKTMLAKALVAELSRRNYQIAFITNPQLKAIELLRAIARYLGAESLPYKLSDMSTDYFLEVIEAILTNNAKDGRDTVVIVDEAHVITEMEVLEELRLLLNFQLENKFLLTLILMGQPELAQRIAKTKQLLQRVALSCHIGPLSEKEAAAYMVHRLEVAGSSGRIIFDSNAIKAVHKASGGIPRRINQLCDLCLLVGSTSGAKVINKDVVLEAQTSFEVSQGMP